MTTEFLDTVVYPAMETHEQTLRSELMWVAEVGPPAPGSRRVYNMLEIRRNKVNALNEFRKRWEKALKNKETDATDNNGSELDIFADASVKINTRSRVIEELQDELDEL